MRCRALALALAMATTVVACSDVQPTARDTSLDDVQIVVGSKDFSEQRLLGAMFALAFQSAGADVVDATGTGGTEATRAALLAGEIDAYVEYNTTGWVELLGRSGPPPEDPADITAAVAELDAANGVEWLGRSPFSNTYGFALSSRLADDTRADRYNVEAFDLASLARYLEQHGDTRVCVTPEFRDRPDGLQRFEEHTGVVVSADQLVPLEGPADVARGLGVGACDVGEVFTTSGLIDEYGLTLVADPGVFSTYNASLTVRETVYRRAPDAFSRLAERVLTPLTQERMSELNRRVSGAESVDDVAFDYLRRFGIVD